MGQLKIIFTEITFFSVFYRIMSQKIRIGGAIYKKKFMFKRVQETTKI